MGIKESKEDKIVVKRSTIERLYDLVSMPDSERLRIAADMLDALLNTTSRSHLQDAMRTVYRSYVDAVAAGVMTVLLRKALHFIFYRRTVTRTDTLDNACIHWRTV